jgi:hypothetical protein
LKNRCQDFEEVSGAERYPSLLACGKCLFLFAGEMEKSKFEEETNSLELRAVSEE